MRKIVCIIAAMAVLAACNTAGPKLSRELRESAPAFAAGAQKRLVAMDLDATLTQHKTPLSDTNRIALDRLGEKYDLLMVGGGGAERIHRQMGDYPIAILGATTRLNLYELMTDFLLRKL